MVIVSGMPEYDYPLGTYIELKSIFFDTNELQHVLNKSLEQNINEVFMALATIFPCDVITGSAKWDNSFDPSNIFLYCVDLVASGFFDLPTQRENLNKLECEIGEQFSQYSNLIETDSLKYTAYHLSKMITLFFEMYLRIAINHHAYFNEILDDLIECIGIVKENLKYLQFQNKVNLEIILDFVNAIERYTVLTNSMYYIPEISAI